MTWISRVTLRTWFDIIDGITAYWRWLCAWRKRRIAMPTYQEERAQRRADYEKYRADKDQARADFMRRARGYELRDLEQRRKARNRRKAG